MGGPATMLHPYPKFISFWVLLHAASTIQSPQAKQGFPGLPGLVAQPGHIARASDVLPPTNLWRMADVEEKREGQHPCIIIYRRVECSAAEFL